MRIIVSAVSALCLVSLGGCGSFGGYPEPLESRAVALSYVQADTLPAAIAAYDAAAAGTPSAIQQQDLRAKRDKIVRARIYAIDINYDDFARTLSTEQKSFAVGSDVLIAGLTGAATLAKSARTKTHLTTYAGGVLGVRASVDKEVYYSKTLPAVVSQMEASRKAVLAKISEGLAKPNADYPLAAALADLQDYYIAGTLNGALTQITKDAGVKSQAAEERIDNVTTLKANYDSLADSLIRYWQPDGVTVDQAHLNMMISCGGPGATARSVGRIVDAGNTSQRSALITCLRNKGETVN